MRFLDLAAPAAAIASVLAVHVAHAQAPATAPGAPPAAPAAPAPAAPAAPAPAPAPAAPAPAAAAPAPAAAAPAPAAPAAAAPVGTPPQAGAGAPQQEPTIYVAQPPLPPLYPRTRLRHDGFYLRLSGGVGYGATSSSIEGLGAEQGVHGATAGLDVLIGGTPGPGLVIGGGVFLSGYIDPASTSEGPVFTNLAKGGENGSGLVMIGPIIDVFPNPYGGLHFGGTVAVAASSLKGYDDKNSIGPGLGFWVGYMGWMSSEWSAGGLLKFQGAWTRRQAEDEVGTRLDVSDTNSNVQLMFSATYH